MELIDCLTEVGLRDIDIRRSSEEDERAYQMVGDAVAMALETNRVVYGFEIDLILSRFSEESRDENGRVLVWHGSAARYSANSYLQNEDRFFGVKVGDVIKSLIKEKTGTGDYSIKCRGVDGGKVRQSRVFYHDEGAMRKDVDSRISIEQLKPIVVFRTLS
jgi:hypothetical protein